MNFINCISFLVCRLPFLEKFVILDLWEVTSEERQVGVAVVRDHGHHPLTHSSHTCHNIDKIDRSTILLTISILYPCSLETTTHHPRAHKIKDPSIVSLTWGPDFADGGDEIQQETVGNVQEPEVATPGDNRHH